MRLSIVFPIQLTKLSTDKLIWWTLYRSMVDYQAHEKECLVLIQLKLLLTYLGYLHDSAPNTMAKEKQKVSSIYFALT